MSTNEVIIKVVTFCFAFGATVIAVLLGFKDYNKRKIAEAKEKSCGQEAIERVENLIKEDRKQFDEFKKDVFDMLFQPRIK